MSYPAQYNTSCRIHSVHEALEFPLTGKESTVELFLFMLDTYDVVMDIASGQTKFPTGRETWNKNMLEKLYIKMRNVLVNRFDDLNVFIPGRLKGWTQGLFWYVEMMLIRYVTRPASLSLEKIRPWLISNQLQSNDTFRVDHWTFMDMVRALEILELRMKTMVWDKRIFKYLDVLEYRCAELCTLNHSLSVLDSRRLEINKTQFQLNPQGIQELMARCTLIRRTADLWFMWDEEPAPDTIHYMDNFIEKQKRQLTQRKFRTEINNRVLENMLRPSDVSIRSYRLKGAQISDYAALAVNRPLFMLDTLGKLCSYGKFEEMMADFRIPDAMYISMVHAHVSSVYNLQFCKYFYLSEKNIHKHKHKLHLVLTPFIIQRCNRYDCMWKNNIFRSRDGSFYWAFITWVYIVRKECQGVIYGGVNLIPLTQLILDKPRMVLARDMSGTIDYAWE